MPVFGDKGAEDVAERVANDKDSAPALLDSAIQGAQRAAVLFRRVQELPIARPVTHG
jgi:hypothetical protein